MSITDHMLCKWAEHKYDVSDVVHVEFELEDATPAWSEYTPGDPASFWVRLHFVDGTSRGNWEEVEYSATLIREILEFAVGENP